MPYRLLSIKPSKAKKKKLAAIFENTETGKKKTVNFGHPDYQDYTQHHDKERRKSYLARHGANQNWTDPMKAGTLARFILWGPYTSRERNIKYYRNKFKTTLTSM